MQRIPCEGTEAPFLEESPIRFFDSALLTVKTLALSACGATVAYFSGLPLPWMLGPLFLLTTLASLGVRMRFPKTAKEPVIGFLGIYLGSSVVQTGLLFELSWSITLAFMALFTLAATLTGFFYFRVVAGYGRKESFLASLPGALAYISVYIDDKIPPAKIVISQSARVLFVVGLAPFVHEWLTGREPNRINELRPEAFELGWIQSLFLATLFSAPAIWLFLRLKIPNAWFFGGLTTSLLCYSLGVADVQPPDWVLQLMLVLIGTMIGLRFSGVNLKRFIRYLLHGFNATLILLTLTYATAMGVSALLDMEPVRLFLAFAPGGVHEMAAIAFAYAIEPTFVTLHHVVRILLISLLVPLVNGIIRD